MSPQQKKAQRKPAGRKPEVLQIEGDWEAAVGYALQRGKPSAESAPKVARKGGRKGGKRKKGKSQKR